MKFENKKLIIFDLDGTLIDSVPDLAYSVNHTLKTINRDTFSEDVIRKWVGNGAQTLVKRALSGDVNIDESKYDNETYEKAINIFLEFYAQNLAIHTKLYDGVKQTLQSLKQKGYRCAIVTNKPFDFVAPILESLGIDDIFEEILGGDSLEVKKPDPKPLLFMCEKLGVDIKSTVMVGDSKNDIIAANNANIESIALTYGYNYNEDISIYNPTLKIDEFKIIDEVL